MRIENPNRHALYSHLYLYINLMECHTGRLWRRHLMPCQNITPVTVLSNFDRLPCQGTEHFMSPICLVLLTGGWVRPENGCTARRSNTHTHWPISLLFVHSHNARFVWHAAPSSCQFVQSQLWNQRVGQWSEFKWKQNVINVTHQYEFKYKRRSHTTTGFLIYKLRWHKVMLNSADLPL